MCIYIYIYIHVCVYICTYIYIYICCVVCVHFTYTYSDIHLHRCDVHHAASWVHAYIHAYKVLAQAAWRPAARQR